MEMYFVAKSPSGHIDVFGPGAMLSTVTTRSACTLPPPSLVELAEDTFPEFLLPATNTEINGL